MICFNYLTRIGAVLNNPALVRLCTAESSNANYQWDRSFKSDFCLQMWLVCQIRYMCSKEFYKEQKTCLLLIRLHRAVQATKSQFFSKTLFLWLLISNQDTSDSPFIPKDCPSADKKHGDEFKNPKVPCETCECRDGKISCSKRCPSKDCPAGTVLGKKRNVCCPDCLTNPNTCLAYGRGHILQLGLS